MHLKRNRIKHVNITRILAQLEIIQNELTVLANILDTEDIDITLLNQECLNILTGTVIDDLTRVCQQVDDLVDPYKEKLQREFICNTRT